VQGALGERQSTNKKEDESMGAKRPFYPPGFWVWCRERLKPETFEHINSDAGEHDRERCLVAYATEQREIKHAAWIEKTKRATQTSSTLDTKGNDSNG
jgi:hypothetical protein